jgi:CubicO group peptidase (beta-lactamase class C family)
MTISPLQLSLLMALASTRADAAWPGAEWPTAKPSELGADEGKLAQARDYALRAGGSGCIVLHGKLVMSWGDQRALYDLKSTSKSIGVTVLGLALKDGKVKLDDTATRSHPTFGVPFLPKIRGSQR